MTSPRSTAPVLTLVLALSGPWPLPAAEQDMSRLDRQSLEALDALAVGDVASAAAIAADLARHYPTFALGQLLHAELSAIEALDGSLVASPAAWPPALTELLLEARARHEGRHATDSPTPFLQIDPALSDLIVVDAERSSLSHYRLTNGESKLAQGHYVSSGSAGFGKRSEGDRKTPLGLYRITGRLSDRALPELYGAGALMLDYPNAIDRAQGRTGHGIWLHGSPRRRPSRGPHTSEGCVSMANAHLATLSQAIEPAHSRVLIHAGDEKTGSQLSADRPTRLANARRLFEDYRDGRASVPDETTRLSPDQLAALETVNANSITILENAGDHAPAGQQSLLMDVTLPTPGASSLTLHWSRGESGVWTLDLEAVSAPDT